MIRHVVLLKFVDGTSGQQMEAMAEALRALPARVPSLVTYNVGPDLRMGEGTWDFGIVADFLSEAGWRAYDDDDEHNRIRTELIAPHVAARSSVRFSI